jgi:hypothetical protein
VVLISVGTAVEVKMLRCVVLLLFISSSYGFRNVFDSALYESVLNDVLCEKQLQILANNPLGLICK